MRAFIAVLILMGLAVSAHAEKRVALVIGNSSYKLISPLKNPKNDARLIASTLQGLDFVVVTAFDVDYRGMRKAVGRFGKALRAAGKDAVGLLYFAGHGVQAQGENYLVPLNADIQATGDLAIEAMSASQILSQMKHAGNRLNVIILDACRNNPFERSVRSTGRGLTRIEATTGSLVAFAAAPGGVADDGSGDNSPYARALAKVMRTPGLKIEEVFKRVRISVNRETKGRQTPWEESSLFDDFYFVPRVATQVAVGSSSRQETSAAGPVYKPVKTFRDCDECPEMVSIPKGAFFSGQPAKGPKSKNPKIILEKPFAVSKQQITWKQWHHCVSSGGCSGYEPKNDDYNADEESPVRKVSWKDAKAYVNWLNKISSGNEYRLLSVTEWEYIALIQRVKTGLADLAYTYLDVKNVSEYRSTSDINGLSDYTQEWLEDCWYEPRGNQSSVDVRPRDGSALLSGENVECDLRMVATGMPWNGQRITTLGGIYPSERSDNVGFRVAKTLSSSQAENNFGKFQADPASGWFTDVEAREFLPD